MVRLLQFVRLEGIWVFQNAYNIVCNGPVSALD